MARIFYTSTTASDLVTGGNFNNALIDAQEAVNTITLTSPQSSTAAGSYFSASGIPGTDGTSTGDFVIRTNITSTNAGINFRANLMRVNAAGTVQTTVLGTYAAASTGVRTQTFTNPALGTWATGDRLRIEYQIENTNAHGGDKGISFETGQLAQDTPFAGAVATLTLDQAAFRARNDDGSETAATWKAAENTNWTQATDENVRVRFEIQETAGGSTSAEEWFRLQYRHNGGTWTDVNTTSSVVRTTASPNVGFERTTDQLATGTGTFRDGEVDDDDGAASIGTGGWPANGHSELEYCVQIRSADVVGSDTVELRVVETDPPAQPLAAYSAVPALTVAAAPGTAFDRTAVDTVAVGSDTVTGTVAAPPAFTTYAADTFERTVAGGWGTADTGGAWTAFENAANMSVGDGVAKVTSGGGQSSSGYLHSVSALDLDITFEFSQSVIGTLQRYRTLARVSSSDTDLYRIVAVTQNTAPYVRGELQLRSGGATSDLTTTVGWTGGVLAADERIMVRAQAEGTNPTTLRLKVWRKAEAEPNDWLMAATDSTAARQAAGYMGLEVSNGGTNNVFSLDNLSATSIGAAQPAVLNRTATDTVSVSDAVSHTHVPAGILMRTATDTVATSDTVVHSKVAAPVGSGVLLVVSSATTPIADDVAIRTRLEGMGHTVTYRDQTADDSTAGNYGLVVLSESCSSSTLSTKYKTTPTPVLALEHGQWDELGLIGATSTQSLQDQTQMVITGTHDIVGSVPTGTQTVYSSVQTIAAGVDTNPNSPGSGAVRIAHMTISSLNWCIFAYDAGATLADSTAAPGRRVAFSMFASQNGMQTLNSTGLALFDNAVSWLVGVALPATVQYQWAGGVTASSAIVAAKLANVDTTASVRLAASTSSDMSAPVYSSTVTADAANNWTVKPEVSGLSANTDYHYAVEIDSELSDTVGMFRTFPTGAAGFTLGLSSCANTGSNHPVFDRIRERDLLTFVQLGDRHYADVATNDIELYRTATAAVFSARQAAMWSSNAAAYTWDDHDYGTSDSDSTHPGKPAALSVYGEQVPHYTRPGDGIWQAFDIGRIRFIVLDTRSERSPNSDTDNSSKTMLGATQKQWFKDELLAARDTHALIIVASAIGWIGATTAGSDQWAGFNTERTELGDYITANNIGSKMVMLSGDMHAIAWDDGTNNQWGGFPVFHASPLDRPSSSKGGPYTAGPFQNPSGEAQYGTMAVTDDGTTVGVTWTGWRVDAAGVESQVTTTTFDFVSAGAAFNRTATDSVGMGYRDAVIGLSPFQYWRFGESSGTVAAAVVGTDATYNNTPNLGQTGLLTGDADAAVELDRASLHWINIGSAAGLAGGTTDGVAAVGWVRIGGIVSGERYTLWRWGNDVGGTDGFAWFYYTGDGELAYQYADGTANRVVSVPWIVTPDETYMLGVSHDYVAETVSFYVDGDLLGTVDVSANGTPIPVPSAISMGLYSFNGTQHFFDGVADDLAVWRAPLSATDMATLWTAGTGGGALADSVATLSGALRSATDATSVVEALARQLVAARLHTDTTTVTDSTVRQTAAMRAVADTTSVSDALAHTHDVAAVGLDRSALDTTTLTDSALRSLQVIRAPPDTVATADSVARLTTSTRTTTDSTSTTDSVSRLGSAFTRTASDTTAVTGAIARRIEAQRTAADTHATTDTAARSGAFTRTATDTTAVTDALNQGQIRRAADTVATTDAVARGGTFTRTSADSSTTAEAVGRAIAASRALAETTTATDSVARLGAAFIRIAADTTLVTDETALAIAAQRNASDVVATADVVDTEAAFARDLSDATAVDDTIETSSSHSRTVDDTVATTDDLVHSAPKGRTVADSTAINDEVARSGVFTRAVADSIPVGADSIDSAAGTFNRQIADTIPVGPDTVDRLAELRVVAADAVSTSDEAAGAVAANRSAADATATSDSLATHVDQSRPLEEELTTADELASAGARDRTVADATSTDELVAREFHGSRTADDFTSVSDEPSTGAGTATRRAEDTVVVSEAVDRLFTGSRTTQDTVATSDVIATGSSPVRTAEDATDVSEAIAVSVSLTRAPVDVVATTDTADRLLTTERTADDATTVDESVVHQRAIELTADDTTTTSDSLVSSAAIERTADDALTTVDALYSVKSGGASLTREAIDSTSTSDAIARSLVMARTVDDTLPTLTDFPVTSADRPAVSASLSADRVAANLTVERVTSSLEQAGINSALEV